MVRPRSGERRSAAHHASVRTHVVEGRSAWLGTTISRYGGDAALRLNSARQTGSSIRPGPASGAPPAASSDGSGSAARQSVSSSTIGPDQSRNVSAGAWVPIPWTNTTPVRRATPGGRARSPVAAATSEGASSARPGPLLPVAPVFDGSEKTVGWSSDRCIGRL